jgi:hypothetical protein
LLNNFSEGSEENENIKKTQIESLDTKVIYIINSIIIFFILNLKKISFLNEKGNENILFNITNDQSHIIEINKNALNLEIGDFILEKYSSDFNKKLIGKGKSYEIPKRPKFLNKKLSRFKSVSSKDKKIHFMTNTVSGDNNQDYFTKYLMNKIPKFKITFKEYLYNTPKCDLCNKTGITLPELRKMNHSLQIDAVILEYVLLQCDTCKLNIHKNCIINSTLNDKNFPTINVKDLNSFSYVCEKCKFDKEENNNSLNNTDICEICRKCKKELKNPHLWCLSDSNSKWSHGFCMLWKNS